MPGGDLQNRFALLFEEFMNIHILSLSG
jgi:hypothetical protein